ncbi:Dehydrogenase [Ignavibacterium album JCM 16511]|uniref:Dehydrogenase n=1 Tax=Ignavibacterium album (strain DSM 19864 / JCM 16511 / NBRC 101810 / Mat9-16) TaxID=945713 RepID=I0AJ93_IGNAJ|nr:SDR family oxidoreductase [Ignavibacterium album]AFH49050.1 Dehydrogenase [Ignavibacterium album JCM 16511]
MDKLNGVWVIGASSGIGKAIAAEFARVGCKVFASARRNVELERLNSELQKEDHSVEIFPCNVASYQNVESTFKKIVSNNKIDCLVNNAGVTTFKLAAENSINEINDIITTNLLGSIYTIKAVLPHMIANGGGTIINILSVVAKAVYTKSSAYTASKMGLLGYTNSLREEVREHNIRLINILPGATETPMWPGKLRELHSDKMMTAEDVARIVVWSYLQKGNAVAEEIVVRPITGDLK